MAKPFADSKVLFTFPWNSDVIFAVQFIGNDKIAAANRRGDILIWDLPPSAEKSPDPVRRLVGHIGAVNRLRLSPDGKTLISVSNDRTVKFWDALRSDGKPGTIVMNDGYSFVGVTEKVDKLPAPPTPIEVKVVEQQPLREFTGHKDWIWDLGLTADGKTLATGDDAKQVILSDAQTGTEQRRWQVNQWIRSLDISPDGKIVVTAEHFPQTKNDFVEAGLRGWDAQTGQKMFDASKLLKSGANIVRFSPDGKHLAVGVGHIDRDGDNGKLFLLNPTTGEKVRELTPSHQRGATDVAFHPDGEHLVTCGRDRMVKFWRLSDGEQVHEINQALQDKGKQGPFTPTLHALSITPDGKLLALADADRKVVIYSLASSE
jgi:WD40 repeat protein